MPRHNGSGGVYFSSRSGGGKISRRTRSASPYDKDHRREDWRVQPHEAPVEMGRKDGNTPRGGSTPQQPKPTTKGGSKSVETVRRRVVRSRSAPS